MKQKEANKMFNQNEFGRLRDILFPRKHKKQSQTTQPNGPPEHETSGKLNIKNQIQKLRNQIYYKLEKDRCCEESEVQTQRIYLDGINRICKNLKDYSKQVSEVFQDFMQHLPTNLNTQKKNYLNHSFLSLLIQNCVWDKIDSIVKKPLADAFRAIQEENSSIREENELQKSIRSKRILRQRNRNLFSANKYFNLWRFKSKALGMQFEYQQYCKQNCLENDRKILQNLLNFPWLVLMLQEINRQNADLCEILLFDEKTKKLCKFVDENTDCLNTSLETVTQRSMLHNQAPRQKIKRHQFDADAGLTKICLQRRQILFLNNLTRHPDFHEVDSSCYSQFSNLAKREDVKGGAIFYPIIDSQQQIIGISRQYFFHKNIKPLQTVKTNKLSLLLELGLAVQNRMRKISDEANMLKEKHYLKMIFLIKKMENQNGNVGQILKSLNQELRINFSIQEMTVFQVQKKQLKSKFEIVLNCLWGENKQQIFLLSIVDKLLREGNSFVYLEKRLIVYHNMMLFDLYFNKTQQQSQGSSRQPVQFLTATLTKIQTILTKKQQQSNKLKILQQRSLKQKFQRQKEQFISAYEKQKLVFFSQLTNPCNRILNFISSLQRNTEIYFQKGTEQKEIQCHLQVVGMGQKQKTSFFQFSSNGWQQVKRDLDLNEKKKIKIRVNQVCNLYLTNIAINTQFNLQIQTTVLKYLKLCSSSYQQSQIQKLTNNNQFQEIATQLVNKCIIDSIPFSNHTKQEWEIQQLKRIYTTFQNIITTFTDHFYTSNQGVKWLKQQPSSTNLQEFKQAVYPFVFTQTENITVNIKYSNQIQELKHYRQLEIIFGNIFPLKQLYDECYLQILITGNKSKFKSISYESPITFKMIVKPHLQESTKFNHIYKTAVGSIKKFWIRLSKSLIHGNLRIDEKNKTKYAIKMMQMVENKMEQTYYKTFQKIVKFADSKLKIYHQASKILSLHKCNNQNSIWHFLTSFKEDKFKIAAQNKLRKFNPTSLDCIQRLLTKLTIKSAFDILNYNYQRGSNILKSGKLLIQIIDQKKRESKMTALSKILYSSKITKQMNLGISALSNFFKIKFQQNYDFFNQMLKAQKRHNFKEYRNPQEISSVQQLKLIIKQETPEFNLFLVIDSFHCLQFYTPSQSSQIRKIQDVNMPSEPFLLYQIGLEGQFLWHYFIKEGQNGYKIKDKLNSLSKFIEQALKHCKQLFSLRLVKLKCFRSKYIQFLKTKYLRKWRNECEVLAIEERNRLNDCLYQLNVETQTTKQKLIIFEKMLKSNNLIFEEMKKKRDQYMNSVTFSEAQVIKIESSYDKLQNARNMYSRLHKRTILKSCLLLWRSNSKKIEYQKLKHFKINQKKSKIAIKSIVSIVQPKYKNILSNVINSLIRSSRKYSIKNEVSKINVCFQQNSRLVTFQSQINEKQNMSERSNSFDSPDSKREVLAVNKFKLNEMQGPNLMHDLSAEEMSKYNNGAYRLNPKTLKFLKRMGKLSN